MVVIPGERVRELERVLLATWPALETESRHGWVLSASEGATGRANSVTVMDQAPANAEQMSAMVADTEDWYHRRQLAPMVRVTPLTKPAHVTELEARGYQPWPSPSDVLVKELVAGADRRDDRVRLAAGPSAAWWALSERSPHAQVVLARMLAPLSAMGSTAFASVAADGEIVAIGLGVVARGHLAIFAMHTVAAKRRGGLARRVLHELELWGRSRSAVRATLQVVAANGAASELYRDVGYHDEYRYHYLRAPSP